MSVKVYTEFGISTASQRRGDDLGLWFLVKEHHFASEENPNDALNLNIGRQSHRVDVEPTDSAVFMIAHHTEPR